jgi:hypothetical protein
MAVNVLKYKIFLASPSDVLDERAAVDEVIDSLNLSYGRRNNIVIELVRWETHSAPGFSLISTQDRINNDLGDDYDLFMGILWMRFGTPTAKAGSGTEEEFINAYSRYLNSKDSTQILFYFKKSAPQFLNEIDPTQLGKVLEFKKSISDLNGLYGEFETLKEFQDALHIHIPFRIDELNSKLNSIKPVAPNEISATEIDELGILDYQEIIEDSVEVLSVAVNNITEATGWIGGKVSEKARELDAINSTRSLTTKESKLFMVKVAFLYDDFVARMRPELPIFSNSYNRISESISKSIDLRSGNLAINKESEISTLKTIVDGIEHAMSGMAEFLKSIESMPRMSRDLNNARKGVEDVLREFISKLSYARDISHSLIKRLLE